MFRLVFVLASFPRERKRPKKTFWIRLTDMDPFVSHMFASICIARWDYQISICAEVIDSEVSVRMVLQTGCGIVEVLR